MYCKKIFVAELYKLWCNQLTDVTIKVLSVQQLSEISAKDGLIKQELADHTGLCRFVQWEHDISKLHEDLSYKILNTSDREFNSIKYLNAGITTSITEITDIGEVETTDGDG